MPGTDPGPRPFPPGTAERTLEAPDVAPDVLRGVRLHLIHSPGAPARPAVFLVPGYTDHAGRYGDTFTYLHARGHAAWGMDTRGHGRSSGPRGYVARFADYVDDLAAALTLARKETPAAGWVLLGHSTGGLIALAALLTRGGEAPFDAVAGIAVTCPLLRLARRVPLWQRAIGAVGARLAPRLSLPVMAPYPHSHDPEEVRRRAVDPLIFHSVNARWFHEAEVTAARVRARAEALAVPILGLQAGADPVVDAATTRDFVARCPRGRYVEFPGMYHEILLEQERGRVFREIGLWLDALA